MSNDISSSISTRIVARTIELCRRRGHDVDVLCTRAGFDLAVLADPTARVLYTTAARLGEYALEITGDENFGLHLAEDVQDAGNFDAGVLLLMASPSVREALDRMVRYQRYWGDGERSTLVPMADGLAIRFALHGARGAYARHADECALAEIILGLRVLTGQPVCAQSVQFRHARPRSTDEHRALFQCPIAFAAEHSEIRFDASVLALPMPHGNASFCAIFEEQVNRALARLPISQSALAGVRAAARAALAAGRCTLADTSRALGTSSRTLQRKLQDEGTSFGEVVEALRRELAVTYLQRGIPIPEVASLLGYSDATAFHHAFRRWTGTSPARYTTRPPG